MEDRKAFLNFLVRIFSTFCNYSINIGKSITIKITWRFLLVPQHSFSTKIKWPTISQGLCFSICSSCRRRRRMANGQNTKNFLRSSSVRGQSSCHSGPLENDQHILHLRETSISKIINKTPETKVGPGFRDQTLSIKSWKISWKSAFIKKLFE